MPVGRLPVGAASGAPAAASRRRKPPVKIQLRGDGEEELERVVVKTAHLYGWCGFHVSFSHGSVTGVHAVGLGDDHYDSDGWPDWVFVRGPQILFRELKGRGKYADANQRRWGALLVAAGQDWKVWKPQDLDEIVATFSGVGGVS
jgi:hypothetical protein